MSYYEGQQQWQNAPRQPSWEQPPPPSRSATSSTVQQDDSAAAFSSQYEDVDRAMDNLVKSGKSFGMAGRRDSLPQMGGGPRSFADYDPRMGGPPPRHHSVSEFDPNRSQSGSGSSLQNFYANQRYQPRPNDAEQMMQAKRRMAAQRERELRNYHQEQQYNRTMLAEMSTQGKSSSTSDRAMSPSAVSEDERRDLIARQHRALYGNEAPPFPGDEGQTPRPMTQGSGPGRDGSPLAYDPFGLHQGGGPRRGSTDNLGQLSKSEHLKQSSTTGSGPSPIQPQQTRSRANSTSSPSSNPTSFSLFDSATGPAAQQSSRTSASSPGGSPPSNQGQSQGQGQSGKNASGNSGAVGPIGSRPNQSSQANNPALNKRSTTPLPSPLSYGFNSSDDQSNKQQPHNERSTSAASNPASAGTQGSAGSGNVGLGWGSKSGVWGPKNALGVQASVWG
ncbi:MAG: hypothetical protein M4579_007072 [Chaenotheca gracillima]|nr:MAG: hypothetical protein M4579_007072 [Chaenotheca gracillima]